MPDLSKLQAPPPMLEALTQNELRALYTLISLLPENDSARIISKKLEMSLKYLGVVTKTSSLLAQRKMTPLSQVQGNITGFSATQMDKPLLVSVDDHHNIEFASCPSEVIIDRDTIRGSNDIYVTGKIKFTTHPFNADKASYNPSYRAQPITISTPTGIVTITYAETVMLNAFLTYHINNWRSGVNEHVVTGDSAVTETKA